MYDIGKGLFFLFFISFGPNERERESYIRKRDIERKKGGKEASVVGKKGGFVRRWYGGMYVLFGCGYVCEEDQARG